MVIKLKSALPEHICRKLSEALIEELKAYRSPEAECKFMAEINTQENKQYSCQSIITIDDSKFETELILRFNKIK